ncbi:MAG TPA: hypothetical protein VKF14_12225 [Candidatus Dormibacteraeota bacterium]|nr:hypothetical protein [Candidatus Dormibacteraeota bacterium]
MGDLLRAIDAIRQALDLGGNIWWFVAHNVQIVSEALHAFIFRTTNPAVPGAAFTSVGPIQTFTPLVQVASDGALTAVITYGSYRIMWGRTTARSQLVLRVLLPRVLLAAVLINFAVPLVQAAVDASNALSDSVGLATHQQIVADVRDFSGDAGFGGFQGITMLVLFASYAVLAFAYVIRFALLVVLTILAPAAALLFVMPETHHYAKEWGSLFVSALLMQPLQLLVLAVGFALDGYSMLPVRHLFALGAVFITFKVPGALHSASLAGSKAAGIARRQITHAAHAAMKT